MIKDINHGKYYYYFYVYSTGYGCGVSQSKEAGFNLSEVTRRLRNEKGGSATISFYKEISLGEYEKMIEIFEH